MKKEIKRIINLTPHTVNICGMAIEPSGSLARVSSHTITVGNMVVDGVEIPITKTSFGEVTGLPAPEEGVIYIVSAIVAKAMGDTRNDIFIPNEAIRDDQGRIIGCKSLAIVD